MELPDKKIIMIETSGIPNPNAVKDTNVKSAEI